MRLRRVRASGSRRCWSRLRRKAEGPGVRAQGLEDGRAFGRCRFAFVEGVESGGPYSARSLRLRWVLAPCLFDLWRPPFHAGCVGTKVCGNGNMGGSGRAFARYPRRRARFEDLWSSLSVYTPPCRAIKLRVEGGAPGLGGWPGLLPLRYFNSPRLRSSRRTCSMDQSRLSVPSTMRLAWVCEGRT